ncbi:glycosyltransferase [Pseudonocardia sp.]|uniref:glycosyltransferase n=1 Tax=Pseudonocardia sp. TaxID=60912 RepID=UPI002F3F13BA
MYPQPFGESLPRVVPGEVVDPSAGAPQRPSRTEPERGPRVALLSLRDVRPIADFGGLHEAEDVLVETLSASLYRVVLASPRFSRRPFDSAPMRRMLSSTRLVRPYRIEHHQPGSGAMARDVLVILASDVADAAALLGVPGWHELGEKVLLHIGVVTESELRRHPELVGQLRRRVDALFSGTEMPPLGHLRSDRLRTVGVVPALLDVLAFATRTDDERTIDVFSPGPERPGQHQLLQRWADAQGGRYQHDIGRLGAITSPAQHRRIFTTMATRSRLLLTNYSQSDRRHGGQHRGVSGRFYDAMAAGCALVGDLPASSRQFSAYVAGAQPLSLPSDAVRLPSELAEALGDPAESRRLGLAAREAALRRNDVAHRWLEMVTLAGLPESAGIRERIGALAAMADTLHTDDPTEADTDTGPSTDVGAAGDVP